MADPSTKIVAWTLCGAGRVEETAHAFASALAAGIDEHLVIDTAPEDAPPIVVHPPGFVRVARWSWCDDFAAARNAALGLAAETGATWGMMLDSDERVICPDPAALRAYLAALPPKVCVVVAYAADGSHGRERFFRLPAQHRWIGRTHEAFPVDVDEQATIPPTLIAWTELPKNEEQLRAKNERDIAMIDAEIAERPTDARWHFYRGGALAGLGRIDEAVEAYRMAADLGVEEDGAMACVRAAELLCSEKKYEEAIAACARGMIMRADVAELPWIAAGASYNLGQLNQAEAWARLAKVHGEQGEGRDALARRVGFRAPRGLREGPGEVLDLVQRARGKAIAWALERDPNPIRITVTSSAIRAAKWAPRCIESVAQQTIPDPHHAYVAADPETYAAARSGSQGLALVCDGAGRGLLENLLPIWRSLPDDEVIVWLDGDDWLATDRALATVAEMHAAGAWATYGQFLRSDGRLGFCAPVGSDPRSAPWTCSHLKTFRAGLVKRIRDEDLRDASGACLTLAIDQAIMIPVLEMAAERALFCPRVLCVYNVEHSFEAGASAADIAREDAAVALVRSRSRYPRLERF